MMRTWRVWALGGRRELVGAARLRVESVDPDEHDPSCDVYELIVVQGSGVREGTRLRLSRAALYATNERHERDVFAAEVKRYWPEGRR